MQLRMWTYDLAREQAPSLDHLRLLCDATIAGGYKAIGLYMEHRFAYPSTPWSHGRGAVTPEMISGLEQEYPDLQIIPFINLLGHFEGMLYTEHGKRYCEERFQGMQACPSKPEFVDLAKTLIDGTIDCFKSEIIHIGGDETWQLGKCPACKARVESSPGADGKATLYGEHFGPLARYVVEKGRRPAVWGDMYLEHPRALDYMPKETQIFDWQYFKSPLETSRQFREKGFDVVCCPTLHVYNSVWMHLPQSEENIRQAYEAAAALDAGVCITTWEAGLFGNYETLLPAIKAAGQNGSQLEAYGEASEWAQLMGADLPKLGGPFAFSGTRSSLKVRLLLEANPFLAWLYHHEELSGPMGDQALDILDRAVQVAPSASYRGVSEFVQGAVQFIRYAEQARQAYANGLPGVATSALAPCRQVFDNLEKIARTTHVRIGGSLADIERCRVAREHVERVIRRIREFGDGSLGYLPAFEHLTHPKFVPHDQAAWWLINRWANE